jgi:putative transposase
MPVRSTPLITGEIYHVFNKTIDSTNLFNKKSDYNRFLFTLSFNQYTNYPVKLSRFNQLPLETRNKIIETLRLQNKHIVNVVAYCLMPNHFHLVLKQLSDDGIKKYISTVSNSYSHYFNTKNDRKGPVFSGRFKAVRIESEEQLQHVVRYVHLNPLTSYIVKNMDLLISYKYSSLQEFINKDSKYKISKSEVILKDFSSIDKYLKFLSYQVDYQRGLNKIRHKIFE